MQTLVLLTVAEARKSSSTHALPPGVSTLSQREKDREAVLAAHPPHPTAVLAAAKSLPESAGRSASSDWLHDAGDGGRSLSRPPLPQRAGLFLLSMRKIADRFFTFPITGYLPGVLGDSTCVRSEKIPPDYSVEITTSLLCAGCFFGR